MIGFNKDLERTQLLSGMLTPATESLGRENINSAPQNMKGGQKIGAASADIMIGGDIQDSAGKNCGGSNIKLN